LSTKPPRSKSSVVLSQRKRKVFLEVLGRTGKVKTAAEAAGYADSSFMGRIRRQDEEFAKEWEQALRTAAEDVLEPAAIERAVEGVMEDVYYQGDVVGQRINYSDQLLMFLLRGAKPEKFRENVNVSGRLDGEFGVSVIPMVASDEDNWEKSAIELHERHKMVDITPKKPGEEGEVEAPVRISRK